MIVTEHFTFVHLHKCGGTFLTHFFLRFFASARQLGYHLPLSLLPDEYREKPVLGVVRNPWDFYASYFFFQMEILRKCRTEAAKFTTEDLARLAEEGVDPWNGLDALFEVLSEHGSLGFQEFTLRALRLGMDDALLQRVLERMPTSLNHRTARAPCRKRAFAA